MKSGMAIM